MHSEPVTEVIFVGLPGPTHHYSGLSPDNVASTLNRGSLSNPKQAALQALSLVRLLRSMGVTAAILPPQLRPNMWLLRQHFTGTDEEVIREAARKAPALLDKACSAAAMWTANAATIACARDTQDGQLHITPANLFTNLHRRIEADDSYKVLKAIFAHAPHTVVHAPLSAALGMRDEGAANHMRLTPTHQDTGLNIFVYGGDGSLRDPESARQTLSASRQIAGQHALGDDRAVFIRQNPEVILQGVFHNDVISVANENVLLAHEKAFDGGADDIDRIVSAYRALHVGQPPVVLTIEEDELSVAEAVNTYFFNSQLVTRPNGRMALIAPVETELLYEGKALAVMHRLRDDPANPIDEVHTLDLRQSMRNGGGPACLRLRVPMTQSQLDSVARSVRVIADETLLEAVESVVESHYPEALSAADMGNPSLYHAARDIQQALGDIMQLPLAP